MARGDFNYIRVSRTLTASNPVFETKFPVEVGNGKVVDDGYLLVTVRSVDSDKHRIRINGQELSGFDIPLPPGNTNAWFTYMDRIQPGVLKPGTNTLQIVRSANDNFVIRDVVVHWREVTSST
jgi:hypothetical protein